MYDLIIIGAGPAGCAAAITAARTNARVLLVERGRYPRQKVCGEFVSAESLDVLQFLLAHCPESVQLLQHAPKIGRGRLFVDSTVLDVPVQPAAASISRHDLDQSLWSAALQAGVDARQQQTVVSLSGTGPFQITTRDAVFESRAVINSAGRWSNLSDRTWINGDGPKWIGLKAHFIEPNASPSVDLYFFPGGYCGVQPVNDSQQINACAMVRSEVAACLSDVFNQHPALRKRSQDWQQATDLVSTSPLIFRQPEPTKGNILLAGDAAGFVDPFVGDGISLALRSGRMAAQCLQPVFEERLPLPDAAADYGNLYDQQLLPIFRASSTIRRLFALPYPARAALLAVLGRTPALTRYLVRKTR